MFLSQWTFCKIYPEVWSSQSLNLKNKPPLSCCWEVSATQTQSSKNTDVVRLEMFRETHFQACVHEHLHKWSMQGPKCADSPVTSSIVLEVRLRFCPPHFSFPDLHQHHLFAGQCLPYQRRFPYCLLRHACTCFRSVQKAIDDPILKFRAWNLLMVTCIWKAHEGSILE